MSVFVCGNEKSINSIQSSKWKTESHKASSSEVALRDQAKKKESREEKH